MEQHTDLNAALCAVKSSIEIDKLQTATIQGKTREGKNYSYSYEYLGDAALMAAARKHEAAHGVTCELADVEGFRLNAGTASGLYVFRFTAAGCEGERLCKVPAAGSDKDDGKACKKATTHARTYAYRVMYTVGTREDDDTDHDGGTDSAALRRKHEESTAPRVPQLTGADVYTAFTRRGKDSRSGWTFRTFLHLLKLHGFPATDKIEEDPDSAAAALRRAIGASPWGSEEWSKVNLLLCDHDPESAFGLAGDPDPLHSFKRLTGASND